MVAAVADQQHPAGGVGRYLVQEEEDLTAAGWRVIPFAMADDHAH